MVLGLKRGVINSIIENIINVKYTELHRTNQIYYWTKWTAYESGDMVHSIFSERIPRTRLELDFDGLEENFIQAVNLVSTRLKCAWCKDGSKISLNH